MPTLLIADDSDGKRGLLRAIARRHWQGEIVEVTTTEEAIAALGQHADIQIAFVDYYMPSANGPAVIRAVRQAFPAAKIALVSSADNKENAAEALSAGANSVVCSSLPDAPEKLSSLLHQWTIESDARA